MSEITHPELKEAAADMMLASIDYDDNNGSSDAATFWNIFERKREWYRKVKKRLEDSGEIEKVKE